MPLRNHKITLQLIWPAKCVIIISTGAGTYEITNARFYAAVTLLILENTKLLQRLNSGFKRTVNWNKYVTKDPVQLPNQKLVCLVNSSFQRVSSFWSSN